MVESQSRAHAVIEPEALTKLVDNLNGLTAGMPSASSGRPSSMMAH